MKYFIVLFKKILYIFFHSLFLKFVSPHLFSLLPLLSPLSFLVLFCGCFDIFEYLKPRRNIKLTETETTEMLLTTLWSKRNDRPLPVVWEAKGVRTP